MQAEETITQMIDTIIGILHWEHFGKGTTLGHRFKANPPNNFLCLEFYTYHNLPYLDIRIFTPRRSGSFHSDYFLQMRINLADHRVEDHCQIINPSCSDEEMRNEQLRLVHKALEAIHMLDALEQADLQNYPNNSTQVREYFARCDSALVAA